MKYLRYRCAKRPMPIMWFAQVLRMSAIALITTVLPLSRAATVWTGQTMSFTKQAGSDWTQPTNQDRMTPNVWITRANIEGLFNIKTESGYTHVLSPADTEWAYGALTNYATLTYKSWETWNGTNPPTMLGKPAVLHLITDDIYLFIQFTEWGARPSAQGGFAYLRSTPPLTPPGPVVISDATVANNQFIFSYNADFNVYYLIQSSSNLIDWIPVATNQTASNPARFTNNIDSDGPWFYRVVRLAAP